MKAIFKNCWVIGIILFILIRFSLGSFFDLRATCHDGRHSSAIGKRGACSHHGGVDRSAGFAAFFFSLFVASLGGWGWHRYHSRHSLESPKIVFLDEDNSNAPRCPLHGKMISIINKENKKCWACSHYPECKYWTTRS